MNKRGEKVIQHTTNSGRLGISYGYKIATLRGRGDSGPIPNPQPLLGALAQTPTGPAMGIQGDDPHHALINLRCGSKRKSLPVRTPLQPNFKPRLGRHGCLSVLKLHVQSATQTIEGRTKEGTSSQVSTECAHI